MMICKNDLCSLLENSLCYVLDEKADGLKPSFVKAIKDDAQTYDAYISSLNSVKEILKEDLEFFLDSDPAATSIEEIKLAYPGFKAIAIYRISHALYNLGYKVQARYISEQAHSMTGIDIHPAAKISYPFFIDHGTGIVIGETSSIGKRCKIYQCVTLGALSLSNAKELRGVVRHPQVGNDVTLYAGASLLGPIHIGNNVTIGSNVFLTEDVSDNVKVIIGKPELIYKNK
ncbi:MAG: serine acetyltransferase [Bacilli bacterium]|nr:serine acetyltransferase [Bacilli bacterium]